jgi:aryl-alcohol dehydrogenase-like predicted oxidoreductase
MKDKVIIGTWPLSGDLGFTDPKTVSETLSACLTNGFISFDTAPNYGNGLAESSLGAIGTNSIDLKVHTKFGNTVDGVKDFSNNTLISSLKDSLKRLRRENVETAFLHNPRGDEFDFQKHMELFLQLKKEGLVKYSGLSAAKGESYESGEIAFFDNVMDDFNLLYLSNAEKYFDQNQKLFARSPLATGILSGNITTNSKFQKDDYRHSWLRGERLESIMKRVRKIESLSDINIKSLAIRYILSNPKISKMIIGVRTPQHVEDLANEIEAPPLSDELITAIELLEKDNFGIMGEDGLGF